jgi:hypothetical protein
MRALAPIAGKLGKLLRLLSSDQDGEVVAAARALVRTLEAEKLDIHALADGIATNGKKFTEEEAAEIYRRGVEDGRREVTFANVEPTWNYIARECAAQSGRLREHEQRFVDDMVCWTVQGGEPTEKQAKWLRAIYARVRRQ